MCPYIAVAITVASTYCAYGLPTRNDQPELARVVWLYSKTLYLRTVTSTAQKCGT